MGSEMCIRDSLCHLHLDNLEEFIYQDDDEDDDDQISSWDDLEQQAIENVNDDDD